MQQTYPTGSHFCLINNLIPSLTDHQYLICRHMTLGDNEMIFRMCFQLLKPVQLLTCICYFFRQFYFSVQTSHQQVNLIECKDYLTFFFLLLYFVVSAFTYLLMYIIKCLFQWTFPRYIYHVHGMIIKENSAPFVAVITFCNLLFSMLFYFLIY